MLKVLRIAIRVLDSVVTAPYRLLRAIGRFLGLFLDRRLGILKYAVFLIGGWAMVAAGLAYVFAPLWGWAGQAWWQEELRYFDERSRGTAILDARGVDMGIFDPRLDSENDLVLGPTPIVHDDFTAYPDHKSLHVQEAPPDFWACLRYHEDRNLGTFLNPWGIDFKGVFRIPFANIPYVSRMLGLRHGAGGSTLAMQLSRAYYKALPSARETAFDKWRRKLGEWRLAPVIQRMLMGEAGDFAPLKRWAANHLPLAQRAGGDLHGVELTARIVFGKPAAQLTTAEQYVLAAAVNKPIIVLPGSERLNRIRLRNWRYLTDVRAKECALKLISDPQKRKSTLFALANLGTSPPQPRLTTTDEAGLPLSPRRAQLAGASPTIRANLMLPAARYEAREEMKDIFGRGWRNYVRAIHLTLDAEANLKFRERILARLGKLDARYRRRLLAPYTLDVAAARASRKGDRKLPDIIVAAANERGEIVRYFAAGSNAHYFGSRTAFGKDGRYDPEKESRAIASIAKMLAAIQIANEGKDTLDTKYFDSDAPRTGLESCKRRGGQRRMRRAETVFACSLSTPLAWRLRKFGEGPLRWLVARFGFNMPHAPTPADETPASTAIAKGLITGSPRRVHQLAGVILAALTGRGDKPVTLTILVKRYERHARKWNLDATLGTTSDILPNRVIRPEAHARLAAFLSSPFCYQVGKRRFGTLRSLSDWCARRRADVSLHFAKTGTQTTSDPDTTVDVWIAGGIRFTDGRAYSYMILVGSGDAMRPLADRLHASQLAAPLLRVLLDDLRQDRPPTPVTHGQKLALEGDKTNDHQ